MNADPQPWQMVTCVMNVADWYTSIVLLQLNINDQLNKLSRKQFRQKIQKSLEYKLNYNIQELYPLFMVITN